MHHPANEQLQQPGYDVIVKFTTDDKNILKMEAHFQGEKFEPEQIKTHAALHALQMEWNDIVAQIHGVPTDAARFRGLLEFSMLCQNEATKDRFEAINAMLQEFEESRGYDDGPRTPDEFREQADFILHALIETAPTMTAPTASPE